MTRHNVTTEYQENIQMVDMRQTRDLRKARATETELAIEQLIDGHNTLLKEVRYLHEAVRDYRKELYGLFPKLDTIELVAVDEADHKELLRQYGNGRKILETERTFFDTEDDYGKE